MECKVKYDTSREIKIMNIGQHKTNHGRECKVKYNKMHEMNYKEVNENTSLHAGGKKVNVDTKAWPKTEVQLLNGI